MSVCVCVSLFVYVYLCVWFMTYMVVCVPFVRTCEPVQYVMWGVGRELAILRPPSKAPLQQPSSDCFGPPQLKLSVINCQSAKPRKKNRKKKKDPSRDD